MYIQSWGVCAALWVVENYMLITRRGDSTMVKPVDPDNSAFYHK